MAESNRDELVRLITKFAESGWDLISVPAKAWLGGKGNRDALIAAIEQATESCGNCGCELDPLYRRALGLKALL